MKKTLSDHLELTHVLKLDATMAAIHKLDNRIKTFQRQAKYHNSLKIKPQLKEIDILIKMRQNIRPNGGGIIKLDDQTKTKITKLPKIKEHWRSLTEPKTPFYTPHKTRPKLLEIMLDIMQKRKGESRKAELLFRLNTELKIRNHQGWFTIYNTLTINPESYKEVWKKNSTLFSNYIKKWDKKVGGKDDHKYFAVVEEGGLNGRLHIHVIHMIKNMPEEWTDPNRKRVKPNARLLTQCTPLWAYGFTKPIMVRYNNADAYARKGWLWPIDETGQPIKIGAPEKLASYLGKYLAKKLHTGGTKWNTRIRRGLGMQIIMTTMQNLTEEQLTQAIQTTGNGEIKIGGKPVPRNLIHQEATREIMKRMRQSMSDKGYLIMMAIGPQPSIINRWNSSTKPKQRYNSQSIGSTETQNLRKEAITKINTELEKQTNKLFPAKPKTTSNIIKGATINRA